MEWVEQGWCIAKLTGVGNPRHDSDHATTVAYVIVLLEFSVAFRINEQLCYSGTRSSPKSS